MKDEAEADPYIYELCHSPPHPSYHIPGPPHPTPHPTKDEAEAELKAKEDLQNQVAAAAKELADLAEHQVLMTVVTQ